MIEGEKLLELQEISFAYEDGTKALQELSFSVTKGEKVAVMGANGSGKSTLFLMLVGILKPKTGKIMYHGREMKYHKKELLEVRSKVGIVFQEPDNQLFSASVYQEISFGPMNLGWEEEKVRDAVERVIEELEITPFREKPTHFLSGGQKKQVSIADIIVMNPELVIMDEPTAALDAKHSEQVEDMVNRLCEKGITVIIATHDSDYALEWADKVILFHEGRMEAAEPPMTLFKKKELLEKTSQRVPKIFQIYEMLVETKMINDVQELPKSIEAFRQICENIKRGD